MKTNFSFITTKIDLNFQSPKYDESKRHFHQKQITTHSVISELRYTYLAVRRMGAICACVLFKRRKLYNFMHCTLYTYQAKQRMFQNIFHFSYFANSKMIPNQNCQLTTSSTSCFYSLKVVQFFNNYRRPSHNFNYSHKRTMTSLCVLGQTKSH